MAEMEEDASEAPATVKRNQRRGYLSRIWRGIFGGVSNEDYEKKLQRLSKEEAAVNARMKRRALSWRRRARHVIFFSATFEVVAVAIAVIALRSLDITGPMKFVRTLPAILLPGLSYVVYSTLESLTGLLDRKDQKTLERLRAERKAKIDELKEMTNYYTTQQLIQRYDLDPAAKVAAATALASRLGAESGLKVYIGDEPSTSVETTKSNSIEQAQSSVLRNRKQPPTRGTMPQLSEASDDVGSIQQGNTAVAPSPLVVEHYASSGSTDGGWIDRIAALLIGEGPSQCYALICGNCRRHNGLTKENLLHVTYYCPHCNALNTSKQTGEKDVPYRSGTTSPSHALGGSSFAGSSSKASSVTSVKAESNVPEDIQE